MFETKIDLFKPPSDNILSSEFFIPTPNLEEDASNPSNPYFGLTETIILYESIHTVYKILKRLKHFALKLDYEFQQDFITSSIDSYKPLIKELRYLLYKPICVKIFKLDSISSKIINTSWEPDEEEADTIMFAEANLYVDEIYNEICEKYEKLDILSNKTLNEKSKSRFLEVILFYINDILTETFSKIKKVIIIIYSYYNTLINSLF